MPRRIGVVTPALALVLTGCAGPLTHAPTEPRWLDPSGRASAPAHPRSPDASDTLRFVVYGDTRGNRDVHRAVVDAIVHAKPDVVLFTGDALSCLPLAHMPDFGFANYVIPFWPQYHRGYPAVTVASVVPFPALLHEVVFSGFVPVRDPTGFNAFLEDTAPLRLGAHVPYLFAPGNHDLYHDVDRREAARLFGEAGHIYRAFDIANVRFVVLDTGSDLFAAYDAMPAGGEQLRWLDATLADAEARGMRTVITMHMPPFSSGAEDGPVPWVEERVVKPIFDKHRVDLVACGHAHAYERIQRRGFQGRVVNYVVSGGGGAPFHHEEETPASGSVIFAAATAHYVLVEMTHSKMRIRMIPVARPEEAPSEDRPDDVTIDLGT